MNFNLFWNKASVTSQYLNRFYATRDVWDKRSLAAQKAILEQVDKLGNKNPYFFVLDFPEPEPTFLRGDEKGLDLVQVRYNGLFKICTRETQQTFALEYVRDWSPLTD